MSHRKLLLLVEEEYKECAEDKARDFIEVEFTSDDNWYEIGGRFKEKGLGGIFPYHERIVKENMDENPVEYYWEKAVSHKEKGEDSKAAVCAEIWAGYIRDYVHCYTTVYDITKYTHKLPDNPENYWVVIIDLHE